MRAAFAICSLALLTAADASAQSPLIVSPSLPSPAATLSTKASPATALPATSSPALVQEPPSTGVVVVPTTPAPAVTYPAMSDVIYTDMSGQGGRAERLAAAGRPFEMCGPRMWAGADYMLMWYTPMNMPTLIRTLPAGTAGSPNATALSEFPTRNQIRYDAVSGVRLNFGYNFDLIGFDVSGFVLQRNTLSTSQFSDGTIVSIAQPYIPAGTGITTDLLSSRPDPNGYSGGVTASISSQVYGFEANARRAWFTFMSDSANVIGGFRYFDLQETLSIVSDSQFASGSTQNNSDSIRTHNSFYGGQIGISTVYGGTEPGLGFSFTTKSGIGGVNQRVDLVGSNSIVVGGVTDLEPGGLYVRGLNAGSFSRGKFAFMQDVDLKLTYNFTRSFQVSLGYSLFYLSSVVRPGDQLNPVVNDTNIRFVAAPTPSTSPQPVFAWNTHSFVMQGITFGASFQY